MCVSNFQGDLSLNGPYNHSIAPGNHYEFSVVLYVKVDIPEISQTDAAHFFSPRHQQSILPMKRPNNLKCCYDNMCEAHGS